MANKATQTTTSTDVDDDTVEGIEGADTADITPPAANEWWKFETREQAEEWANNAIQKRLTRERKTKLEPLQQTNATLEAEVARLTASRSGAEGAEQLAAANAAAVEAELQTLRDYKAGRERQELISEIANDVGLDDKFHQFITTKGDADAIEAQAKELLNALSESGANTSKRTPAPKAPKETPSDEAKQESGAGGGGGSGDESDEALIASILEETAKNRQFGTIHH